VIIWDVSTSISAFIAKKRSSTFTASSADVRFMKVKSATRQDIMSITAKTAALR
jgi:hypothetical protein